MHRPSLNLALGVFALCVLAANSESATAFPPIGVMGSRSANGCGNANAAGLPATQMQSRGSGMTNAIYSPAAYRTAFVSQGRLWFGSSSAVASINSMAGNSGQSRVMSSVFSPYSGFGSRNSNQGVFDLYSNYFNSSTGNGRYRGTGVIFPVSPYESIAPGSNTLPGPWAGAYRAIVKFNFLIL
jgi:hypothetical protein